MHSKQRRREIRKQKEKRDKDLLAAERELWDLYDARRKLPWVKLDKPIQRGWVRTLVLRDDIARRSDAHIFKAILKQVSRSEYSKREDFKVKNEHGRYVDSRHEIHPIGEGQWEKLGWSDRHRKHFHYGERYTTSIFGYVHSWKGYWFFNDYMFETKIEPNILTHVQEYDADLEARIDRLDRLVWHDWNNRGRLTKLHGWEGRMRDDWNRSEEKHKDLSRLVAADIKQYLDYGEEQ